MWTKERCGNSRLTEVTNSRHCKNQAPILLEIRLPVSLLLEPFFYLAKETFAAAATACLREWHAELKEGRECFGEIFIEKVSIFRVFLYPNFEGRVLG